MEWLMNERLLDGDVDDYFDTGDGYALFQGGGSPSLDGDLGAR